MTNSPRIDMEKVRLAAEKYCPNKSEPAKPKKPKDATPKDSALRRQLAPSGRVNRQASCNGWSHSSFLH